MRYAAVPALVLGLGGVASAQQPGPSLGAESGVYAEAYSISGRAARRPGQTLRIYASPTFSWMGFEIGTTLLWSTENQFAAQTTNRYYLNPRWGWGQLHAGDYTPSLSRLTASAVRIRGGGLELTPGRLRVAAAAGLAQDASDASAFDAAPRRRMYAGLLGYGSPSGTFLELSALRAADDSVGTGALSAAPQENVVAALGGGLVLGRFRFKGEYGASLFSRDIRASELDSLSQPGPGESVFTPRLSSRFDQAWSAEARFGARRASLAVQFEEVGPGFTTLGNPYLPNDKREARLAASVRLFGGRLSTSGTAGLRRDNLAGDKRGTTWRRTGSLATTLLTGRSLVTSLSVLVNGLTLAPAPLPPGSPDPGLVDSFRLQNVTLSVALMQQARFGANTLSLSLASQRVTDQSPRFDGALDAASTSVTLDWAVAIAEAWSVSLRPGYQRFRSATVSDDFASAGLSLARRAPRSPWSASVAGTWTQVQGGGQWRSDAAFGLRLSARDQLAFQVRHTRLVGVVEPFTETLASLRVSRRW